MMVMMVGDDGDDDDDDDDIEDYDRRALLHHEDDVSGPLAQEEGPLVLDMLSTSLCSFVWLETLHLQSLEMSVTMSLHSAPDRWRGKGPCSLCAMAKICCCCNLNVSKKGEARVAGETSSVERRMTFRLQYSICAVSQTLCFLESIGRRASATPRRILSSSSK